MNKTHKLTRADVPDGSKIAVFHDIHIPFHDDPAMRLAVECCERAGVTHVVLNGDIADCGVSSRHDAKRARDTIDLGRLHESVTPGRWIYDWARTRWSVLMRGNHERWVEDKIESDPSLSGAVTVEQLLGLPSDGEGWRVLDSESRIRLGSLVIEHGHGFFPTGSGGENPGNRIRKLAPNQITMIGHLHRRFATFWTVQTDDGNPKTYGAFGGGHMSIELTHAKYTGGYPGWQQSFSIVTVYYIDGRPRFTIDQIEVHRDRHNRPVFEYQGHVYR